MATLVVIQGQVAVLPSGFGQREVQAVAGEALSVGTGDKISVGTAGAAELRLSDGSTVELAANTAVDVTELLITDNSYQVRLQMLAGRTVSRVVHVLGVGERFEISTPSSTASVRGTVFTVEVLSQTETFVDCDEGEVEVAMGNQVALVEAGMMITAVVGQPLQVRPQTGDTPVTPTVNEEADEAEEVITQTPTASPTGTVVNTPTPSPTPTSVIIPTATSTPTSSPTAIPTATSTASPTPTVTLTPTHTAQPPQVTICHIPPGNPDNAQTITVDASALPAHLAHGDTQGACPEPTHPPSVTDTPPPPPPADTPPPSLVTICHIPSGNPDNAQTISVPQEAVQAHLAHGDSLGSCP
jgi:hypothetical protein